MPSVQLFEQVKLYRDVPNTIFPKGDQGTVVEFLPPNEQQLEADYLLEMFDKNETLDVIAGINIFTCFILSAVQPHSQGETADFLQRNRE